MNQPDNPRRLGDFEVVRELGHGGTVTLAQVGQDARFFRHHRRSPFRWCEVRVHNYGRRVGSKR
jgi:hypothetical protein